MKRILPLAILGLAACEPASPLVDTSGVRVVTQAEVVECTPVSTITTTTGVSGELVREKALELARNETLEEIRATGADTAVLEAGGPGSDDFFVRAAGYRCLG
ncbi:hypothetical protein [Ovoidimarina sediminis]|uniref:hypothetical protein n=1 Tax=Ovoidimarina sediminis TaxID=3079856 RepID=UPI00290FCC68|nr:hypothetical protein [Rhodophyticola sp. MJ-SS7]MDU8945329.1 hypothetical protein [Rhodophyticola sp. MJ-SS7]